ncbi:MAG: hypothetical protein M1819_001825 [Sarea resinae]|nr:MAG: hypothetical protein M1819_001825 [Sarea resinae]
MDDIDGFAQTREPDDLFDDDFTPAAEPVETEQPVEVLPPPIEPGLVPAPKEGQNHFHRGQGERRGRGGRHGAGGRKANTSANDKVAATSESQGQENVVDGTPAKEAGRESGGAGGGAVRGDRSRTGGVRKPKLTEDELSARLASIALKNASLEAAHARAEADEEAFQEREQQAQAKRREERQNRHILEGEREKNRLRKLKAVQGREWDAEKKEEDYSGRGGRGNASQFRRGAYGGVAYDGGASGAAGGEESREEVASRAGRGGMRGSRGRGGIAGGRGRGGYGGPSSTSDRNTTSTSTPPKQADFPPLPASAGTPTPQNTSGPSVATVQEGQARDPVSGSSWAEQVEASANSTSTAPASTPTPVAATTAIPATEGSS